MEAFLNASKAALVYFAAPTFVAVSEHYCYFTFNLFYRSYYILQSRLSFYQTIRVVLGNPTCDLDSAVCALVQGLLEYTDVEKQRLANVAVIPVMNIPEKEFRIKTEVVYSLKSHGISPSFLTFRWVLQFWKAA